MKIVDSESKKSNIEKLRDMRRFSGEPKEFWLTYLTLLNDVIGSETCFLLKKKGSSSWSIILSLPNSDISLEKIPNVRNRLITIASQSTDHNFSIESSDEIFYLAAGYIPLQADSCIVFLMDRNTFQIDSEKYLMNADIPISYQHHYERSKNGIVQVIDTLDTMSLLNNSTHFVQASMTICNEVASKYQCSRVSLGWVEGEYIDIKAISHLEKFDKKTEILKLLSQVMEESLDQDIEVHFPLKANQKGLIFISHKAFSSQQHVENILSIPLRLDGRAVAVLTCERAIEFGDQETKGLRVLADQAVRRLSDLKYSSRWFGSKVIYGFKRFFSSFLGVRNTGKKLLFISLATAVVLLAVIPYPYRVEASFNIKTENMVLMPAPFDGYVKTVYVKAGDSIQKGSPILDLDTEELVIQESILIADISRYEREQRKHLINDDLSDMKIAASLKQQSLEKLKEIRFYINNSSILAKRNGIIVEGELDKMIGAPVKKGDVLYKMASIENLYVELEVNEEYINEIKKGTQGSIVFITEPKFDYPITVEQIVPVSVVKDESNKFIAKGSLNESPMNWWRPGMTGVAKLNAGSHSLLWILFKKTIDFIYLKLWW